MYFPTENDIPDFGSIHITHVGCKITGTARTDSYGKPIDFRIREYVLNSEDITKLALINNAADGSKAVAADTGDIFLLCEGVWNKLPDFAAKWRQIPHTE